MVLHPTGNTATHSIRVSAGYVASGWPLVCRDLDETTMTHNMIKKWEIHLGTVPGIVFGYRNTKIKISVL